MHLLLTPECAESIASLIIALGRKYVQYINKTYHRTGTLWDKSYKSSLIQQETYLLNCQRYIDLNPVRASMVEESAWYRFRRYRFNGLFDANQYVSPHPVYLSLGKDSFISTNGLQRFIYSNPNLILMSSMTSGKHTQNQPLGNSRFYTKIKIEKNHGGTAT